MHNGAAQRVDGDYPVEVVGLVHDLNRLIETQAAEAERARSNAAKLGHGLKTPLAVLAAEARALRGKGEAAAADSDRDRGQRDECSCGTRACLGSRHRPSHGASAREPRSLPLLERLVPVMKKLPGGAPLDWSISMPHQLPPLRIDQRDIEDILGNLLDNARKWARSRVDDHRIPGEPATSSSSWTMTGRASPPIASTTSSFAA